MTHGPFALRANECSDLINKMEIPDFYKECILNLQELFRKGGIIPDHQDEILWGNNKLKFNNAPLTFKHWSKQGIHCISDMIKNGEIDREGIREKLVHKAGFMFEIQTMKAALPPGWLINIERKRDDFTDKNSMISKSLQIPSGKIKPLAELNAKDIYNIFLLSKKVYTNSQSYWSSKFPSIEIDWNICFKGNFVNPLLPQKCKDFNWKMFYGLVNSEVKLKRMEKSTGCCYICKNGDENLEHLLYFCNEISSFTTTGNT